MSEAVNLVQIIILFFLRMESKQSIETYSQVVQLLKNRETSSDQDINKLCSNLSDYINFISDKFKLNRAELIDSLQIPQSEEIIIKHD